MVSSESQSPSSINTVQNNSESLGYLTTAKTDHGILQVQQLMDSPSIKDWQFRKCNGVIGVPISFLNSYCPNQYLILGYTAKDMGVECLKFYEDLEQSLDGGTFERNMKSARFSPMIVYPNRPAKTCYRASNVQGYMLKTYGRILICRKDTNHHD